MIKPYLALVFGIFALSLSSLFVHWAEVPGIITSLYRMLFATLVLSPVIILLIKQKKIFFNWKFIALPIIAGIFTALDHSFWSTSIGYTNIANATLFNNIAPIWVALFGIIVMKEKLYKKYFIGLFFTLVGVIIIYGNNLLSGTSLSFGDGLALTSSIFYAGYFIVTQKGRTHYNTLIYLFIVQLTATMTLIMVSKVNALPLFGYSSKTYLIFLGAAVISQIGGYFSISYALGHLPASYVSPTMVAQPLLTSILAIPLANEVLKNNQIIGGLLILLGIFLINFNNRHPNYDISKIKAKKNSA